MRHSIRISGRHNCKASNPLLQLLASVHICMQKQASRAYQQAVSKALNSL